MGKLASKKLQILVPNPGHKAVSTGCFHYENVWHTDLLRESNGPTLIFTFINSWEKNKSRRLGDIEDSNLRSPEWNLVGRKPQVWSPALHS